LQAWNVITENFDAVSENPEFLDMAVDSLLEVIKYDDIQVGFYHA
jgi:BTB And C-terminal Kelch